MELLDSRLAIMKNAIAFISLHQKLIYNNII